MTLSYPAFELLREQRVASLDLDVTEFRHRATGAMHYHLAADNPENVFLVAVRTLPDDSTGVAHILEHTVLCGSERFPVRDPFFMMLRRSLNTFMNAMTTSDATAYPFASQNRKDFDNLLQVYLDAVFFARLDEFDFLQEGHRLEWQSAAHDAPLMRKGVVLNEMLGAMSSPVAQLAQAANALLYPSTTYRFNCGGDPAVIPQLRYADLVRFYRTHYHPSNALFLTFGDIPAAAHQARFEELALSRFSASGLRFEAGLERRLAQPLVAEQRFAWNGDGDPADKCHVLLAWLLGDGTDIDSLLDAHLLSSLLIDNSASPLRHLLETCGLGKAPSPLLGLEDAQREMSFACGLEGCRAEDAAALEAAVLQVLQRVARDGVAADAIDAALHQLELSQREIGGDGQPFGLQLMMQMFPAAVHRGDPLAALNVDPALARLAERARAADYLPRLVSRQLLDNPHRIRLTLVPDITLAGTQREDETRRLAAAAAAMNEAERAELSARAAELAQRQARLPDADVLPRLGLADVPPDLQVPQPQSAQVGALPLARYSAATNGLAYVDWVVQLSELDADELALLPLLSALLPALGAGEHDYLAVQAWQARCAGGLDCQVSVRGSTDAVDRLGGFLSFNVKGLVRNFDDCLRLLRAHAEAPRFDELERIRELVAQERADDDEAVIESGHRMAMFAAAAGVSAAAAYAHASDGLAAVAALRELDENLDEEDALAALAERLVALHRRAIAGAGRFSLVTEAARGEELAARLAAAWPLTARPAGTLASPFAPRQVAEAWLVPSEVSYCARAYPSVPFAHPDAPALTVLGIYLRNGFLHRAIREQGGAYGSGAGQDNDTAAFRFFSYRDPRLAETLRDFDASIDWLLAGEHSAQALEEAVLGVIGAIDRPGSPAGMARQAFYDALHGRDAAARRRYRAAVLQVGLADLRRVADTYLRVERASTAVVTGNRMADACAALGLTPREL